MLEALDNMGHVFANVEVVTDVAGAGAKGLVAVWENVSV